MRYVLASGSPRRRELLKNIITDFEIIPAVSEENSGKDDPGEMVEELSFHKASEIFHKILTDSNDRLVVIGADTVVSYNHRVLGKPSDRQNAAEMLHMLSKSTHKVYTGVTLFYMENGEEKYHTFSECTKVSFADISDDEINEYVASGECDDKAGAYGIQGIFCKFIEGIEGDYYNVVGLPVARLYKELKSHNLM